MNASLHAPRSRWLLALGLTSALAGCSSLESMMPQALVGRHDFSTFRDTQCQANSPLRTLDYFRVSGEGERVLFDVGARSFLHRQVRSMVGSLVQVGLGRWRAADLAAALAAADRTRCGPVAPPDGLYLERVDYPAAPP